MKSSLARAGTALQIGVHADAALRSVRVVLAVLSCFVIGAYRPLVAPPVWRSVTLTIVSIVIGTAVLNELSKRLPRSTPSLIFTQVLDVIAVVALAITLDEPLDHDSWVLLLVPVVSAAVRLNAFASFLSWVGGCAGYLGAVATGVVDAPDMSTLLFRIPGTLLAIAITVSLLARWMREGWEIQNELTEVIGARERRLAVIEQTQQALANRTTNEALKVCANQIVALGFDAATVQPRTDEEPAMVVGRGEIVAVSTTTGNEPHREPIVTVWTENATIRVHSVSVYEPQTGAAITGWSELPVDADQARALAALVNHTSNAIETSTLLTRLRHNAAHDALTGLANRRSFDHDLLAETRYPGQVALLFIDLDSFKAINDDHGHTIGDRVLVTIARRLEAAVGDTDLVARYGGDEFVILMPNTGLEEAQATARKVLESTGHPIAFGPLLIDVGLSIGVAAAATPTSATALVTAADQAVYQAKAKGKGTLAVIDATATP